MKKLSTCLWFNDQAEEAAQFYASLFKRSKVGRTVRYGGSGAEVSGQKKGSVMTVELELEGHEIMALNGGPMFKFTPANSFFVWCETEAEIKRLWDQLAEGGTARMGLDRYPWAERYGWTADRFGVEWQIMLGKSEQKIVPALLFVDALFGKGEEAIKFYTSVFKPSKIDVMHKEPSTGTVMHCRFSLGDQQLVLMEGAGKHGFGFSTAFSLMVPVDTQEEVDDYWTKLTAGGEPEPCGWLKDKFGMSWQIVPRQMGDMMADPERAEDVMAAVLKMKKPDLKQIQEAYGR